jgi:NADH-quinone oxidoreductase subunit E
MVNWEFFDNQTPSSAKTLVDSLRAGEDVAPTRGADRVCSFKQVSRVLAGFLDEHANEGVGAGGPTLEGTRLARTNGWTAPPMSASGTAVPTEAMAADAVAAAEKSSGTDAPAVPASTKKRAGTVAGKSPSEATTLTGDETKEG